MPDENRSLRNGLEITSIIVVLMLISITPAIFFHGVDRGYVLLRDDDYAIQ
jgi:hypothetical protein